MTEYDIKFKYLKFFLNKSNLNELLNHMDFIYANLIDDKKVRKNIILDLLYITMHYRFWFKNSLLNNISKVYIIEKYNIKENFYFSIKNLLDDNIENSGILKINKKQNDVNLIKFILIQILALNDKKSMIAHIGLGNSVLNHINLIIDKNNGHFYSGKESKVIEALVILSKGFKNFKWKTDLFKLYYFSIRNIKVSYNINYIDIDIIKNIYDIIPNIIKYNILLNKNLDLHKYISEEKINLFEKLGLIYCHKLTKNKKYWNFTNLVEKYTSNILINELNNNKIHTLPKHYNIYQCEIVKALIFKKSPIKIKYINEEFINILSYISPKSLDLILENLMLEKDKEKMLHDFKKLFSKCKKYWQRIFILSKSYMLSDNANWLSYLRSKFYNEKSNKVKDYISDILESDKKYA